MSDRYYTGKQTVNLIDVLDRVLDKGVVIIGDIEISLCDVKLLSIRLHLLIASVERAMAMGIDFGWAGVDKHRVLDLEKRIASMEERQSENHGR